MKITIVGLGYVGLSNAALLAQNNKVVALDVSREKVDLVNARVSPIADADLSEILANGKLDLAATTDSGAAYRDAEIVIVATPTDYDPETNFFDTSSVESVIAAALGANPAVTVVIRSTIPVGFVARMREQHKTDAILFAPEFLREGQALYDNLYPSRIVVGDQSGRGETFARLLLEGARKSDVPVLLTGPSEAEAIKLFANTYLAMRVAFFNELDSYAIGHNIDARQIIDGVGLDPRIGDQYNNPSFGYGGYCLPKDTRQMLANYADIPQSLIGAIVEANTKRKDFLAATIMARNPRRIGIYRLVMKADSDNFRQSSVQGIMKRLSAQGVGMLVYEPSLGEKTFLGASVVTDLSAFKAECDVIVANRLTDDLTDVMDKVFTRDLFGTS